MLLEMPVKNQLQGMLVKTIIDGGHLGKIIDQK
jgi:hypothetical protein